MGALLTSEQAAVRLNEMRAIAPGHKKDTVITAHGVRTFIRAGRLKAQLDPSGTRYLINEDDLHNIRDRRSGRKKLLDRERWSTIRREIMELGRSVALVARAHNLDPVTVYRYLKNDGLRSPASFIHDSEWAMIHHEIFVEGRTVAWSATKHRYTVSAVLRRIASEGLRVPHVVERKKLFQALHPNAPKRKRRRRRTQPQVEVEAVG